MIVIVALLALWLANGQGGWIYLDGVTYPNNSIVNLLEIGTHNTSLHCYTNLTVCCRSSDDPESRSKGFWRFPNGSHVGSLVDSTPEMFSRTRGLSTVILHRGRLASDSGIFTCEVPDSNLNTQSLFIGIYPLNKGAPEVIHLTYDLKLGLLTCTSTDGPATEVLWNKNGPSYQQTKAVVNTVNSTYHNYLSITSSDISDHSGLFSCAVFNKRGSSSKRIGPYQKIALHGQRDFYQLYSNADVTCYSNLTVAYIKWISSNEVIVESSNRSELSVSVSVASYDLHGSKYACEVYVTLPQSPQLFVLKTSFGIYIMNQSKEMENDLKDGLISAVTVLSSAVIVLVAMCIVIVMVIMRIKYSRIPKATTVSTEPWSNNSRPPLEENGQDVVPADIDMVDCLPYAVVAVEDIRNAHAISSLEKSSIYETIF